MSETKEELLDRIARLETELDALSRPTVEKNGYGDWTADTLDRFLNANSIAVNTCDINGTFYDCNEAFAQLLGYSREELLSGAVRWDMITPPRHRAKDEEAIRQISITGSAEPFEKEYWRKDGTLVPVLIAVRATNTTGEDCLCFVIDMTEQKQKESELRRSESEFRSIIESIPQIVFTISPEGKSDFFNQRWYDLTGLEPGPGFENRWPEHFHPADHDAIRDAWAAAPAKKLLECEARLLDHKGQFIWVLMRALPVYDSNGDLLAWFGTTTDIDAQKRAEEELRASETRFRTLADAIPQIVWTADPHGNIDFFNHRWFEYTGLSVDQSLTGGWKLLIHPDDLPAYLIEWNRALETGDTYECAFRLKRVLGIKDNTGSPYRKHLGRAVALRGRAGQIIKWFATWTELEHPGRNEH